VWLLAAACAVFKSPVQPGGGWQTISAAKTPASTTIVPKRGQRKDDDRGQLWQSVGFRGSRTNDFY